jgi:hypothetical protein
VRPRGTTSAPVDCAAEIPEDQKAGAELQVLSGWEKEAERIKAGIATPQEHEQGRHRQRPFKEHVDPYEEHLQAATTSATHQDDTV